MPVRLPTTKHGSIYTANGDLSAEEVARRFQASADLQPLTTRCVACDWLHEGTAGDGRLASESHRRHWHPELFGRRVKRVKPVGAISVEKMAAGRAASLKAREA